MCGALVLVATGRELTVSLDSIIRARRPNGAGKGPGPAVQAENLRKSSARARILAGALENLQSDRVSFLQPSARRAARRPVSAASPGFQVRLRVLRIGPKR
jgi:hypothetical protein